MRQAPDYPSSGSQGRPERGVLWTATFSTVSFRNEILAAFTCSARAAVLPGVGALMAQWRDETVRCESGFDARYAAGTGHHRVTWCGA